MNGLVRVIKIKPLDQDEPIGIFVMIQIGIVR